MQGAFELNAICRENKFLRWRLLGRVLLFFVSGAFVLASTASLAQKIPGPKGNLVLGIVAALGAFALTMLFVRWERLPLQSIGAAPGRSSLLRFALGFLAGLALFGLYASISAAAGHVRWVRAPGTGFVATVMSLLTYIALSCREELGFHGYPLLRLKGFFGVWGSQIIVALAFAAEHMAGGLPLSRALLGAGVGSLMFGMAAITTRGLAVPIGLHAAWNFGDWILGGKGSPGLWQVVVEEGQQQRAQLVRTIVYLAVMSLATIAFWMWYRSKSKLQLDT
jgi:membrane protease YdiL (CAAX protease family)